MNGRCSICNSLLGTGDVNGRCNDCERKLNEKTGYCFPNPNIPMKVYIGSVSIVERLEEIELILSNGIHFADIDFLDDVQKAVNLLGELIVALKNEGQ